MKGRGGLKFVAIAGNLQDIWIVKQGEISVGFAGLLQ